LSLELLLAKRTNCSVLNVMKMNYFSWTTTMKKMTEKKRAMILTKTRTQPKKAGPEGCIALLWTGWKNAYHDVRDRRFPSEESQGYDC
jgi:hypothetical protein